MAARTRAYREGVLIDEDFPVDRVSDYVADPACLVWVDVCAPGDAELDRLGEELQLHALALEDAGKERQRPKLDRYDTHFFVTSYEARLDVDSGTLSTFEVDAFVTRQALVTVRKTEDFDMEAVVRRWDESPDLAKFGVAYLLYGLLDHVVDSHFTAVQTLDDQIEDLEDLLFDDRPHDVEVQRRSFQLRKSLVLLRRAVVPMREVVNSLLRRDLEIVGPELMPFYQDVYDHVLRATEWTESLRDLVSTILETTVTIQGNRMNAIMKKVTSWAAIIAVPTAITGFYGQNVPYPGYATPVGFWTSTAVIVVMSTALYVAFRRRDWL
jgi:magnesium transporter